MANGRLFDFYILPNKDHRDEALQDKRIKKHEKKKQMSSCLIHSRDAERRKTKE